MDPIMELALLQRRFPDVSVNDFGNLIKDAFCARCIDSHTYEGRIFVTEKAVFFASSYSDAKVYDVHIASGAIESVTAFHRSIIPSLEFTLTSGKEEFTNFHNLSSVVKSLSSLLPGKVHEVKPNVAPIKLNRMTSVPARPHPLSPPVSTLVDPLNMKKVPPCPFFLKGGFCPRQPFCQFEHGTPSLPLNLHQSHIQHSASTNLEHVVNMKSFHLKHSGVLRSPTKRLHVAESSEGEGSSLCDKDMTHSQIERLDFGKISLKKKDEEVLEYVRSQSLPDRELKYGDDESHSHTNMGNGNKTEVPDRSSSDSALGQQMKVNSETAELCTGEKRSKTKAEGKVTNGEQDNNGLITGATPSNEGDASILVSPELVVPKKFDFLSTSDETGEVVPVQESNNDLNDRDQSEEGVFVFTGSSSGPSSPDYVKSKKKTTSVSFNLSAQEIGGEGEAISKDEMSALLAQQLELGGSDSEGHQLW